MFQKHRYWSLGLFASAILLSGCASTPRGDDRVRLVERTASLQKFQLVNSIELNDLCDAPSSSWPFIYYHYDDDWYSNLNQKPKRGYYILASTASAKGLPTHSQIQKIDGQRIHRLKPQDFFKLLNQKFTENKPVKLTYEFNSETKTTIINPVSRCISEMGVFTQGWISNKVVLGGIASKDYSFNSISVGYLRHFTQQNEAELGILYGMLYTDTLNAQVKSGHDPRAKYSSGRVLGVSAAYGATMALLGPVGAIGMIFAAPASANIATLGMKSDVEQRLSETHQVTDVKFIKAAKKLGHSIDDIIKFWEKYKVADLQNESQAIKFGSFHPVSRDRINRMTQLYELIDGE